MVDKALFAVAERLRELAPDDRQAARLSDELRRRARVTGKYLRRTVVPWAVPPEEPYAGCKVDWATGLKRIACANGLDTSILTERPGCFGVACGLALQRIEKAHLRTNLHPENHGRLLGKFARVMRRSSARTAWGIDVGSSSLKAVKLGFDGQHDHIVMEDAAFVEHKKLLRRAVNEEEREKLRRDTLEAFLSRKDLKGEPSMRWFAGQNGLGP